MVVTPIMAKRLAVSQFLVIPFPKYEERRQRKAAHGCVFRPGWKLGHGPARLASELSATSVRSETSCVSSLKAGREFEWIHADFAVSAFVGVRDGRHNGILRPHREAAMSEELGNIAVLAFYTASVLAWAVIVLTAHE